MFSFLATIYSKEIISFLNLDENYSIILPNFIKKLFLMKLLENINNLIYSFLIL